jgi:GGDEF domain-containing protein
VFNIVDFHRLQLEHGLRAGRQLMQRIVHHIEVSLTPGAAVSVQRNGTIVVMTAADREEAERAAQQIVDELRQKRLPVNGNRDWVSVDLACGIIAFSQTGQAVAESIQVSVATETRPMMAG